LRDHLAKSDSSIADEDYFAYIFRLYAVNPVLQIVLTTHPIPTSGGTVHLGTEPLPEGNLPAGHGAVDVSSLYSQGLRGRELAAYLAGEEFVSSKGAIQAAKEAKLKGGTLKEANKAIRRQQKKAKTDARKAGGSSGQEAGPSAESQLIRLVGPDDGDPADLRGLWARWGSRLRIRCTGEEIYRRLTGSHVKVRLD
jgi:hypothetical protein